MPIYEYVCDQCGKKTEVIQSFKQAPPKACPHCGGKLKKMHSAPAFHLKGSGWYKTDYASGGADSSREGGDEKAETGEKAETSEKAEKTEKADKSEKSEKAEKSKKADKAEKADRPGKKMESKDKKSSD